MVRTTRSTAKGKNTTATPTRNTRSAGRGKNKNVAIMDEEKPKKKQKKSKEQPTTGKQQPKAGMKVTTSDFYMHAASDFDALVSKKMKAAPKSKRSDGGRVPKGEKGKLFYNSDVLSNVRGKISLGLTPLIVLFMVRTQCSS